MCVRRDTNTLTEILTVKAISVRYNTKIYCNKRLYWNLEISILYTT